MSKRRYGDTERPGRQNRERHPPHLKGREIGMFYARRQRSQERRKRPLGAILLSPKKREQIQSILSSQVFETMFMSTGNSYEHVEDSSFKRDFLRVINETIDQKLQNSISCIGENSNLSQDFYEEFEVKKKDPKYLGMLAKRKNLPAYKMKSEILNVISENQIVVISGETGCGKTTQVAQFILDDFLENKKGAQCRILCTQPRRISAISVAQRVADERSEKLGHSVGYQIRLEKIKPREQASITYCTTGVVQKLMEGDPALSWVSHLILDEIHERDVVSDFILALVKKITPKRPDLKIVLMSATLNSEQFSKYYNNAPHLNIPGFTYPVKEYYLEDVLERTRFKYEEKRIKWERASEYSGFIEPYIRQLERSNTYSRNVCRQLRNPQSEEVNTDLIFELLVDICKKEKEEGAILVFVTGFMEISNLMKQMETSGLFPRHKYRIHPLHSLMPTLEQKQIFDEPPQGVRKIVVATNIAETSITIDDVVYVIDCGKIKMSSFDIKTNREVLAPQWVSLANANQRRGRAGRVKPGVCFHLFTKAHNNILEQYQLPEILRTRLEGVILTAKYLQLGDIGPFFASLLDAPDVEVVTLALNLLKRMNALTDDEKLTPLGYHLAKLPISPQMGKMILFGAIFSCIDPILSIAATLDFKEPFQLPVGLEKEVDKKKMLLSNGIKSDHILFHRVLKKFDGSNNRYQFCRENFLNHATMKQLEEMKKQFMQYLHEMEFVPNSDYKSKECNKNSDNLSLVKAVICAGLYPNIAISKVLGKKPSFTPDLHRVTIHPKSILNQFHHFDTNMLVYYRKIFSNSDFLQECTLIHPLPVVFFGDRFKVAMEDGRNVISINDSLLFTCRESTTAIIKELRDRFNWFLEYKISHPGPVQWDKSDAKILELIIELITCEDLEVYDDDTFDDRD